MLKTRVITSVILIVGFLGALFFSNDITWSLLTLLASLIALWEWTKLIELKRLHMQMIISIALMIGLAFTFTLHTNVDDVSASAVSNYRDIFTLAVLSYSVFFWILVAPIWLMLRKKVSHSLSMSTLGLLLLLATWLGLIGLHHISPWLLLAVLATVWIADSAAYFSGKRFGRNKLAPQISPGKTWEGVAGALVAVTLYGSLLCYFLKYSPWLIVGLWLIVVLSIMGDLFESLLKRQAGLKDSSQLLPGHGGVLDRIDGLIPSLPLVLFYIYTPLLLQTIYAS